MVITTIVWFNNGTTYKFRSNSVKNVGIHSNFHTRCADFTSPNSDNNTPTNFPIFPLKIKKNSKSTNAIYRPPPSPRRTHQSRRPGEKTRDRIHSLWCGPCPWSKRASQCYLDETNDDRPRCLHGRCVLLSAPTHLCPLTGRSMHWPRPPTASLLTRRHLVNFVIFNFNLIGIQLVIELKLNQLTLNFF